MLIKEKIKQVKGNIRINEELLNKYSNVKDMFENAESILTFKNKIIKIYDISELKYLELESIKIEPLKKVAYQIFNSYHISNIFFNNGDKIIVTKKGINESVEKIFNTRAQRDLLKEHLIVFAHLHLIIENAILSNQTYEMVLFLGIIIWISYTLIINIIF